MYFQFLDYFLPFLTNLNAEMQSEGTKIHILFEKIENTYKTITDCYIKRNIINTTSNIFEIDLNDLDNYLPLEEMYLGPHVAQKIQSGTVDEESFVV